MSPSTSRPQDAMKHPPVGTYTCRICNVHDKGGVREFYMHYNRTHFRAAPERTRRP